MRMPTSDCHSAKPTRLLPPILAALAGVFLVVLSSCEGDATDGGLPVSTTPDASQGAASHATETVISLTDDGFLPDNVTVREGSSVRIENMSDGDHSIRVAGAPDDEDDAEGEPRDLELKAGQSIALDLPRAGAYVLTVVDQPDLTASVIVS